MALPNLEWNSDWLQGSWANTRSIWAPLTSDDEAIDNLQWAEAVNDTGRVGRIVVTELCQLVTDIYRCISPRNAPKAKPTSKSEDDDNQ